MALVNEGGIAATIGISWAGGQTQYYGFNLVLPSVSDMVSALVDILKDIVGLRRKRQIPFDIFAAIGEHTEKLFENPEGKKK